MASILISRSMIRIFSGFKHFLAPRREVARIPKLQAPILNLSIVRSAQKAIEFAPPSGQKVDRVLYYIDSEIRRTGRISKRQIEDVFGEVKYSKYASSTQSLLLLRCLGSLLTQELPEVRNKLVQEIWDTLIKLNIPMDISHYNTLLRVYIENGHNFSPIEFLSSLEKTGIEPNRVTYQRLITRYCHEGDIDGASKILEFIKERELPVNENIFNSLIMGHARTNDMDSAHGVISVMKTSGLAPSSDTFMNLMVGYAEKGDIEGLDKVLTECEAADVQLQNQEYIEVIYALAAKGHSRHISTYIEKLEMISGYQQDAMNLIYRLINAGCDEVAYQMFETMPSPQNSEGETLTVGTFFLKQLIRSELYSLVTIVKYCQMMKREGLNIYALERSLQFALSIERPELAVAIMRVMLEDGAPLRTHYFWPVFINYANQGEKENIYKTLKDMISMEVPLSLETCRVYLMPALLKQDMDEEPVIMALKDCGMSVPSIINGCVAYYLQENDIVSAAQMLVRYNVKITNVLRRDLSRCYVKSKDAVAAATVLRQMINLQKKDAVASESIEEVGQEDEINTGRNVQDIAGIFLMDVLMIDQFEAPELLEPVLQAMKTLGISINKGSAVELQSKLGEHLTEPIVNLLKDLTSGDLTLQPLIRETKPLAYHSIEELKHRLTELEIKNVPHSYVLGQLLTTYTRMKNVEKAEEVRQKMDAQEVPLTAGQYVLFIDMYVSEGQLEKAIDLYQDLRSKEPDVKVTASKVLKMASAMVSHGMLEEAIKLLEDNAIESSEVTPDPSHSFACSNFLNNAIGNAGVSTVVLQRLLNVLIQKNYSKPVPSLFAPLIKAHLANDDLNGAMDEFEKICKDYQLTPYKHQLTLACIKSEDTEKLQKIMDLSIDMHGEMNSLYDLVFAFLECGKLRQAKKILETPGLRARHQRLESRCKRLLQDKKITELEHLVTITKDVFDVDRHMMFMHLLEAYKDQGDCDKAVGVWTTMQEENVEPSELFLWELGQFLQKLDRDVPFVMPNPPRAAPLQTQAVNAPLKTQAFKAPLQTQSVNAPSLQQSTTPVSPAVFRGESKAAFLQALSEKNFEAAIEAKEKLQNSGSQMTITEYSKLIECLVQESKLKEATELAKEMVIDGKYPVQRVFKYYLNKVSQAGEVETFTFFEKYLDEKLKRELSYSNRECNTYMNAGRGEEYVDYLSKLVDGSDLDIAEVKNKFPAGGILGVLEKNIELYPKVMDLAVKYSSHGILTAANSVWAHHFKGGSFAEAKEVYDKYLVNSEDNLRFATITKKARETKNTDLLPPLLEILNSRLTTPVIAKGIAYSCWVDILCAQEKYDEALGVLEGSLKDVDLKDYNRTALNRIKEGRLSSNKTFPYIIPEKVMKDQLSSRSSSSSSSSSSSDSDRKA